MEGKDVIECKHRSNRWPSFIYIQYLYFIRSVTSLQGVYLKKTFGTSTFDHEVVKASATCTLYVRAWRLGCEAKELKINCTSFSRLSYLQKADTWVLFFSVFFLSLSLSLQVFLLKLSHQGGFNRGKCQCCSETFMTHRPILKQKRNHLRATQEAWIKHICVHCLSGKAPSTKHVNMCHLLVHVLRNHQLLDLWSPKLRGSAPMTGPIPSRAAPRPPSKGCTVVASPGRPEASLTESSSRPGSAPSSTSKDHH